MAFYDRKPRCLRVDTTYAIILCATVELLSQPFAGAREGRTIMSVVFTEAHLIDMFGPAQPSPIEHGKKTVRKLMSPSLTHRESAVAYRVVLTNGTRATDRSEPRYAELEPSS